MEVNDIIRKLEVLAPPHLALDWDNSGLQIGDTSTGVTNILLALDIDERVIDEAISLGAELIVTHHPLIFKGVKNITTQTKPGQWMIKLIQNGISVYASHTNLDIAEGGVNDSLFEVLELTNKVALQDLDNNQGMGRVGDTTKEYTLQEFANFVSQKLNTKLVRYVGEPNAKVTRVALCGGAASDLDFFKSAVNKGAQVYITGDIRYHETQRAQGVGINLIDGTHFATENIALKDVKTYIEKETANQVKVHLSQVDLQPFKGVL